MANILKTSAYSLSPTHEMVCSYCNAESVTTYLQTDLHEGEVCMGCLMKLMGAHKELENTPFLLPPCDYGLIAGVLRSDPVHLKRIGDSTPDYLEAYVLSDEEDLELWMDLIPAKEKCRSRLDMSITYKGDFHSHMAHVYSTEALWILETATTYYLISLQEMTDYA